VVNDHPGISAPVVRSSLVCPFVDGEEQGIAQVGVLALPDVPTPKPADREQPITVVPLAVTPDAAATEQQSPPPASTKPIMSVAQRGVVAADEVQTPEGTSFAVTGAGTLAPGLAAEQTLIMQAADLRGISTAPCTAPSREHWFVGGSGEVGRRGRIILANPTNVPAVVDLTLWDEAGPVEAAGTQDVAIPARSQRIFLLDALAAGSMVTGVHVTTSRGRVSAALEMRETDEITPQGMTFIPAAAAPATDIVVPGVPDHGQRTLRILAPGETDAIVSLRILGPDGAFSPLDRDVLTVPAGTIVDVPLDAFGSDPFGLRLTSDEPITAAVRVVDKPSDDGLPDIAYTAATQPLPGPAPALLSRAASGFTSTLLISSIADTTVRATVSKLGADGTIVPGDPLDIAPGSTVPVALSASSGSPNASVIVTPQTAGTIVVAREITAKDADGTLIDLMPLVSPTTVVDVPEVVGELPSVPDPVAEAN
jgi:hypothetical protein